MIVHGATFLVNLYAAARSKKNVTFGCNCRKVAGTSAEVTPSIASFTIVALVSEKPMMIIRFAFITEETPMVIAYFGTLSNPIKSEAASSLVFLSKLMILVLEASVDPGSLNPMCPVLPIPRSYRSMPPD